MQGTVEEMAKDMVKSGLSGETQASAAELYAFMKRVRHVASFVPICIIAPVVLFMLSFTKKAVGIYAHFPSRLVDENPIPIIAKRLANWGRSCASVSCLTSYRVQERI